MQRLRYAYSLILVLLLGACAPDEERPITVRGSDTMVAIGQKWAEIYMQKFPEATIQVNGGGSGTGISALINRIADICQSSRPMKKRERDIIKAKYGRDVIEIPVAKDGIVIYVHETNPLSEISISQMKAIYTGKIKNWKELGWEDKSIVIYGRENSSGTYEFFKKRVLDGDDFDSRVQTLPGTGAIANAVAQDKYSIGYGGIAYSRGIKFLAAKATDNSPAVTASELTIADNSYPVSRDLYFYLVKEPQGRTKEFINWILSDEGQSIAIEEGYFPIRPIKIRPETISTK